VKQTRYEWLYLYAAVEPKTGDSVALQAPSINTETMSIFLRMLSTSLAKRDFGVVIMDQAGWHRARRLEVPENIAILFLPPYSPELNPVERLWAYLRSHYLSNRAYETYKALLDEGAVAWRKLTPERLRSVCACDYLGHEVES
jgi:transposase